MLQITEDTPPDMLAGAMDLTVHLPTGRSVKMSVERSTPMMDLLVQVTTNYHLQLSGYTLQALGMAPSKEHSDSILPYKPNTPIGALDTQHIRVVPKARNMSVPKNVPPGHLPFESTFRLKVHLPRNQLFVTRVSHSVHLGDIMKKVCEEKNLDPLKYEFRHPGNLDEILDPKLTLSDYTITEIYLVQKGSLNQTFSTSDIMALRKEEERKQMHTKTGGGVFNLIFRRGKSSTGSLSSENRSISPTHSDDSRSVTPPGVQPIVPPPEPVDKPKPPQRKRRPAPKPPVEEAKKTDTGLTVCHSRNSSDSSGYHEASILSDNCNTSLPRRPKSTMIAEERSQSTSNLSKMSVHSKSTSSLAFPSRKKKSAPPPPPPVLKPETTEPNLEEPSPVVASQPCTVAQTETPGNGHDSVVINNTNPKPTPRIRKTAPSPRPRSIVSLNSEDQPEVVAVHTSLNQDVNKIEPINTNDDQTINTQTSEENRIETVDEAINANISEVVISAQKSKEDKTENVSEVVNEQETTTQNSEEMKIEAFNLNVNENQEESTQKSEEDKIEAINTDVRAPTEETDPKLDQKPDFEDTFKEKFSELAKLQKTIVSDLLSPAADKIEPPQVIALHPKLKKESYLDSYSRKRGFKIGSSLVNSQSRTTEELSTPNSVASALNAFGFVDDEIRDLDEEMFSGSSDNSKNNSLVIDQLHGMHNLGNLKKTSGGSLRSNSSFPGFMGGNMKKWSNVEELDDISLRSYGGRSGWVIGDPSDTESVASTTPLASLTSGQQSLPSTEPNPKIEETPEAPPVVVEPPPPLTPEPKIENLDSIKNNELETDWQYQLPSPPKAFRDSSPVAFTDVPQESIIDSVVTSPELFEKLKVVKDNQSEKETVSDLTSMVSEEERPILNKLSLENLEKRKSLVYNRELATSLKMSDQERKPETFSSSLITFEKTYDEVKQSSPKQVSTSTLPNFKITTYNNTKKKIDIFEDDTIRSGSKRNSVTEPTLPLQKSYVGGSMENISFRKNSVGKNSDDELNKNSEYKFYKPPPPKSQVNRFRSESFSKEQRWVPSKPVSRSKSQIAINKYKETKPLSTGEDDTLTKSNSLFDVSGLQSLGVMRLIQNKLNTPTTSTEQLDKEETSYQKPPEIKNEVQTQTTVKTYKTYRPPAVNMGTWSDRPKIPVNVKDDPDYKYSVKESNTSKLVVKTFNNEMSKSNTIEVSNKTTNFTNSVSVRVGPDTTTTKNVSIKVNGFEPVNQNSGNVVIKIGGDTKPVFRKPLGNVENQRPHSIAFGSDFDISRVPIVRSVEFKKPYKDYQSNTSITQINPSNNFRNGYKEPPPPIESKPVFRVNSYLQNSSAPVVRGFRNSTESTKISWNQPHSFSTLPAKPATKNFTFGAPKPFSQSNLRRTESTNLEQKSVPPAPVMPKVFQNGNATSRDDFGNSKEQLLQAIRDFGGKKGLRAVKA